MVTIQIRILAWSHKGVYRAVCLENSIAVEADSLPQLRMKVIEAQRCFFNDMTEEEISDKRNYCRAEYKYIAMWHASKFIGWFTKNINNMKANFDTKTNKLKFA